MKVQINVIGVPVSVKGTKVAEDTEANQPRGFDIESVECEGDIQKVLEWASMQDDVNLALQEEVLKVIV